MQSGQRKALFADACRMLKAVILSSLPLHTRDESKLSGFAPLIASDAFACGHADAGRASLEHVLALHEGYHAGDPGHEFRTTGSGGTNVSDNMKGWGTGGELVSMSDLHFSRIIGEVRDALWDLRCTVAL